jgi:hypothetical protein
MLRRHRSKTGNMDQRRSRLSYLQVMQGTIFDSIAYSTQMKSDEVEDYM